MPNINLEKSNGEDNVMQNTRSTNNNLDTMNDLDMDNNTVASDESELTDNVSRAQKSSSITSSSTEEKSLIHPDFSFMETQILPAIDDEEVLTTGRYTWEIKDYSRLTEDKVYSPEFTVGSQVFRILLFPKGSSHTNIALYLAPRPPMKRVTVNDQTTEVPVDPKWYTCAQFTLIASNPNDPRNNIANTSHQRFNRGTTDWGFSNFTEYKNLTSYRKDFGPLLEDNTLHVTAFIKILKDPTGVLWHNFLDYDSKTETGFVGFNNQGATCYLNSLLQSYYFTKSFRKAVYKIPTADDKPESSVPLALQRIFYQLQRSDDAVDTQELTKSFGWNDYESFTQHDVQELNRILMDRLESSMKGTAVDSELNDTFVGKMKSYIKCLKVDYESSRIEDFWDIQLNVRNFHNLHESFQDYINTEILNGENQYSTPDYGMQDAQKGVIFEKFPSVLHLQLKRFDFDFVREILSKVNDRHEFPESIDLSPFLEKKVGQEIKPCIYDLHGVLIHAGDIANGHYYTMIRPDESDKWYRFDDDRVWRVTKKQVFEENFGMAEQSVDKMNRIQFQNYQIRRQTNAYMLVYIKRDDKSRVLGEVTDADAPIHVSKEIEGELMMKAKLKKDEADRYLYTTINVYTKSLSEDFEGFDIGTHDRLKIYQETECNPYTVKVLKIKLCKDIFPEIAETLNLDPEKINWWSMSFRKNGTLRPSHILKNVDDITIEKLHQTRFHSKDDVLNIWIENTHDSIIPVSEVIDVDMFQQPTQTLVEKNKALNAALVESHIFMLIIKFFDVESQKLKILSYVRVSYNSPIKDLFANVAGSLGLPIGTEFKVYEELGPRNIEEIDPMKSHENAELSNGDILIFETKNPHSNTNDMYPFFDNAIDYCEYLLHRTTATVKMATGNKEDGDEEYVIANNNTIGEEDSNRDEFQIIVSSLDSLDELAKIIGKKIGQDPNFIKILFQFGAQKYTFKPPMTIEFLMSKNVDLNFQYEILSIPFKELENMQTIKVNWLPKSVMHSQLVELTLNKKAKVSDLIEKLCHKLHISQEQKENLFVWATVQSRFNSVMFPSFRLEQFSDEYDIYACVQNDIVEATRCNSNLGIEDEKDSDDIIVDDRFVIVPVLHFSKDIRRRTHGISFLFAFKKGETLTEGIKRLQVLTGLGSKEFSKIKLCLWDSETRPVYFRNPIVDVSSENSTLLESPKDEIDPDTFSLTDDNLPQMFLGLDHPDRSTRTTGYGSGGISIR